MIDVEKTAKNIRDIYLAAGKGPVQFASELHVSTPAIYKWFRGQSLPSLESLALMCDMYGKTMDEVVVREYAQDCKRVC